MSLAPASTTAPTTRDAVRPALTRMVERLGVDADQTSQFWKVWEMLTRESLDYVEPRAGERFSGICRDGTPWQFCAVLDGKGLPSIRYLTEVGRPFSPLPERTALARRRVGELLPLIGASQHAEQVAAVASLVPDDAAHIAGLWIGFAMSPGLPPKLRVYANNGWGDVQSRWLRLVNTLGCVGATGFASRLQSVLGLLVPAFSPVGFAVTVPAASPTCKLYLRPLAPAWPVVRRLAQELLSDGAEPFLKATEEGLGRRLEDLPAKSLLVSLSGKANGDALDLKLDFCGHCLFARADERVPELDRLAAAFGLSARSARQAMRDAACSEVAFIGVGSTAAGERRINVYLTAPSRHRVATPRESMVA
jgi:hypothetical protein